ncbi:MAG TPA: response regulator [Gammaproteobacteria bacterium]|jgi:CheY-like chemotaxis protein|nr:response regulator [Gammaproteobacteria bacterium]
MNAIEKLDVQQAKPRILLIEDELIVQNIHRLLLEKIGYEVNVASNGAEALQKFGRGYNLIFADVGLPDMNGIEVIKAIREYERNNKRTPIIVLTAYQDEKIKRECLMAGADCVYMKPIGEEKLAEIIIEYDVASLMS